MLQNRVFKKRIISNVIIRSINVQMNRTHEDTHRNSKDRCLYICLQISDKGKQYAGFTVFRLPDQL